MGGRLTIFDQPSTPERSLTSSLLLFFDALLQWRVLQARATCEVGELPAFQRAWIREAAAVADLPVIAPIQVLGRRRDSGQVVDLRILDDQMVKRADVVGDLSLDGVGDACPGHARCAVSAALVG